MAIDVTSRGEKPHNKDSLLEDTCEQQLNGHKNGLLLAGSNFWGKLAVKDAAERTARVRALKTLLGVSACLPGKNVSAFFSFASEKITIFPPYFKITRTTKPGRKYYRLFISNISG
jgi:hypothetical protein